ncbi:Uncharacterised protein [uncultured archaeon]|nr:Uncharacterised protein [uncultured archaeon]
MKVNFKELDYKKLGARWKQVISAVFLLLLPIWIIIIRLGDYRVLYDNDIWLSNLDNALVIAGVSVAFYVTLMAARRMEGTRFGPGIGLLALGLFFMALNDIFWWAASLYQDLYLVPKYGSDALLVPEAMISWIFVMSEHYFALLEGLFVVLAAFALRDIFETVQQLQIEIDREKTKREVSRIVESDYFERIRNEGINFRKNRKKI